MEKNTTLQLTNRIATKQQLHSLIEEIQTIHEQAVQGHIRREQTGKPFAVSKPSTSLSEMLELYGYDFTIESLATLEKQLEELSAKAPYLRVILSSEPTEIIKAKLVQWFRDATKQPVLLNFGIQPGIAGGCMVYTPNHRYDFSLRTRLLSSDAVLVKGMEAIES